VTAIGVDVLKDFATIAGLEILIIDNATTITEFEKEVRWNQAYHRLAQGL